MKIWEAELRKTNWHGHQPYYDMTQMSFKWLIEFHIHEIIAQIVI